MLRARPVAMLLLLGTPGLAEAKPLPSLWAGRDRVAQATVTVPAKSCAGAVVERPTRVLTAAHCVPEGTTRLDVVTRTGLRIAGSIGHLDRVRDLALIDLEQPVAVEPLAVATELPRVNDRVLFVGRVDRRSRTQIARVTQLGECPSLPGIDDAVFTTLQAKPGDSGAPLVDTELRVVGLVHGGSACHIAAPTAELGRALQAGELVPSLPRKGYRVGPFLFERFPNGFRFSFDFQWSSKL